MSIDGSQVRHVCVWAVTGLTYGAGQYAEHQRCQTCGRHRSVPLSRTPRDEEYLLGQLVAVPCRCAACCRLGG